MAEQVEDGATINRKQIPGYQATPVASPASWVAQNALFFVIIGLGAGWLWYSQGPMALVQASLVIVGLGLVIFVHELGHFLAAKSCDVYVKTFSIGFGPALPGCSFRRGETLYMVGALPLGGYVQMAGENTEEEDDSPRSFKRKSVFQRMAIISAGVVMNVLFGLICFLIVFRTTGLRQIDPTVWLVASGGPAWKAGMKSGTTVTSISGKAVHSFDDLRIEVALSRQGVPLEFVGNLPDGTQQILTIAPERGPFQKNPVIGIAKTQGGTLNLIPPLPQDSVLKSPCLPGSAASLARVIPWGDGPLPSAWGEEKAENPLPSDNPLKLATALGEALVNNAGKKLVYRLDSANVIDWPADGFMFGDQVLAMSDPAKAGDPFSLTPVRDFFDWRTRLQQLAGQSIVMEVSRGKTDTGLPAVANGPGVQVRRLLIPAGFRKALPGQLTMGLVAEVRDGSAASQLGVVAGDKLTRLELLTAAGKVVADLDLNSGTVDPLALAFRLREKAILAGPGAMVRTSLNRGHKHQESKPLEAPLLLAWDFSWFASEESAINRDSPLSIPELGLAYRVETIVSKADAGSSLMVGDRIEKMSLKNPKGKPDAGETKARWVELGAGAAVDPKGGQVLESRFNQGAWLDVHIQDQQAIADAESGISLKVNRAGENLELDLPLVIDPRRPLVERGLLFEDDSHQERAETLPQALSLGWHQTVRWMQTIYMNIARIFTRDISTDSLGGPIEIAAQAFSAAQDPLLLVLFLGIISINLAVVNFLPIPLLDGGHMVFLAYEAIARRPPPAWVSAAANYAGLAFILSLFAFVIYNDLKRRVFGQ